MFDSSGFIATIYCEEKLCCLQANAEPACFLCLHCKTFQCQECDENIHKDSEFCSHERRPVAAIFTRVYCMNSCNGSNLAEFFCRECDSHYCEECWAAKHSSFDHKKVVLFKKARENGSVDSFPVNGNRNEFEVTFDVNEPTHSTCISVLENSNKKDKLQCNGSLRRHNSIQEKSSIRLDHDVIDECSSKDEHRLSTVTDSSSNNHFPNDDFIYPRVKHNSISNDDSINGRSNSDHLSTNKLSRQSSKSMLNLYDNNKSPMPLYELNVNSDNNINSNVVELRDSSSSIPNLLSKGSIQLISSQEKLASQNVDELASALGCSVNMPLKCLSIYGNTGDGKSYTLNKTFFDGHEVFLTSANPESCTLGAYAAIHADSQTLVIDTEGLLAPIQNSLCMRERMLLKLFAVSDVVVYRTRAAKLHNDMFSFLSDASTAYMKYFREALNVIISRCGIEEEPSALGPSLLIFHETTCTNVLSDELEDGRSAVAKIKKRFAKLNLPFDCYSSIDYVGIKTEHGPTNFQPFYAKVRELLTNNNVRSPRKLSVIFKILKVLNDKFDQKIALSPINMFPEEYFTCSVCCLACGNFRKKCSQSMSHLKDNLKHESFSQCKFVREFNNEILTCSFCYAEGRKTVLVPKMASGKESLATGILKYLWSGCMLDCPYHGVVYRSRKHWVGNKDIKECSRVEIIHVWPEQKPPCESDVTPRKVVDGIATFGNYIAPAATNVGEWVTDIIAPAYWKPNRQIKACFACGILFNSRTKKHHCRVCGEGFCDKCSSKKKRLSTTSPNTLYRVCDTCYDRCLMPKNIQYVPSARKVFESVTGALGTISSLGKYPIEFVKEGTRPSYWRPDVECINCCVCHNAFNEDVLLHHCRCCGDGVCEKCSMNKIPVPQKDWHNPVRVCDNCVQELFDVDY